MKIITLRNHKEMAEAIKVMRVRGAPAIGVSAGFGLALASLEYKGQSKKGILKYLKNAKERLAKTRPTAVNLFWALERVMKAAKGESAKEIRESVVAEAKRMWEEDIETNKKIGKNGAKLIKDGYNIETHCNAGSLATVYYGTALAPIYTAYEQGKKIHVWVDETRPRLQGARLTVWELQKAGVPCTLITDNMAGHIISKGMVDMVIVGADRIAGNGDTANKIGTYMLALSAKENRVPFYVAAPFSTVDKSLKSGKEIPIEERDKGEVVEIRGKNISTARQAKNFAFDVTPAKYIKGIITEKGIFKPSKI
jgi:methylthioribose-1-phosphate isomerase